MHKYNKGGSTINGQHTKQINVHFELALNRRYTMYIIRGADCTSESDLQTMI
jgi:hypothetical protein